MRGVVTAGMVTGLEMLGLPDTFDVVYGSSGGASNGAYFVAGQAAYGTTIYYDHINTADFINFWRPFRNKPVVDFYFVTDQVMVESVILDWKEIINSPIPLKVLASSVENGDVEVLENFQSQHRGIAGPPRQCPHTLGIRQEHPSSIGANFFWTRA